MDDVEDALVDGHAAADAEDAHGDDEAPEVDLGGVPARPENHAPRPLDGFGNARRRSVPVARRRAVG